MGLNQHQLEDPDLAHFYQTLRTFWAEAENNPPSGHSSLVDSDGYLDVDTPHDDVSVGATEIDEDPPTPLASLATGLSALALSDGSPSASAASVPAPSESVPTEVIEVNDSQPKEYTESQLWPDCQWSAHGIESPPAVKQGGHDKTPAEIEDKEEQKEVPATENIENQESKDEIAKLDGAKKEEMPPPPVPVKPKQRLQLAGVTISLPSNPKPEMREKYIKLVSAKMDNLKKLSYTSTVSLCIQDL